MASELPDKGIDRTVQDLHVAAKAFADHLTRMNADTITVTYTFANGRELQIVATDTRRGDGDGE